ncbi:MAG: branched-chain amino acid ABC transporter permease [Betaproteobacteria bacterium]|nr:branched-chain amino acid ABC transporter permease [Betaproteobacteria bacterium]
MNDSGMVAAPAAATSQGAAARYRVWLAAAVVLAILPYVPGLDSDFGRSLLSQMGIAAVFALSYNVLFGQTGLLSFGHAVYFGLGGYAAIHFMRAINHGLPIPIALVPLAGAAGGLLFGLLFGAVTTRRAGTIFALISLGVGELVYAATFMLPGYFGGEEGITASRTKAPSLFGLDFGSQVQVYYVIALWALVAASLMHAFARTPVGRICNAVRDNPERAEFIGYNTQRVRFFAFAVAGLFAGLAGGLHAINYEIVAADAVSAQRSGAVLLMAYIGGAGHFVGPILGAVALTWLQTSLSGYTAAWLLYAGLFFVVIILFAPAGLSGLILMHGPIVRTRAFRRVLGTYVIALVPAAVMAIGAVLLIEMSYRLSTQHELGTRMRLLWVSLDAGTPWPWLAATLMLIGGFLVFRKTWRRVAAAWQDASDEARTARFAAGAR